MSALVRALAPATTTLTLIGAAVSLPAMAQEPGAAADAPSALRWVAASNGAVPLQALAGGAEKGETVYLCRAEVAGDEQTRRVGTLRAGGGCEVPLGTQGTATRPAYEVLTGAPWMIAWRPAGEAAGDDIIVGGAWQGQASPLCQIDHYGGVHSGMLVGERCMVAVNGKTLLAGEFRYAAANMSGAFAMRWASQGWAPQGALTVTSRPSDAIICLARAGQAWWPGILEEGVCTTAAEGAGVLAAPSYQTIVADPERVSWTLFREGRQAARIPDGAVAIGGQSETGAPVSICRAQGGERLVPGHVTSDGQCAIANSRGQVARVDEYEVLLYRQGAAQTAGR